MLKQIGVDPRIPLLMVSWPLFQLELIVINLVEIISGLSACEW